MSQYREIPDNKISSSLDPAVPLTSGSFPSDDVRTKSAPSRVPSTLKEVYRLVEREMEEVTVLIGDALRDSDPTLDGILRYAERLGGKRLRPLLVLLSARACGGIEREHLLVAAALEMIHTGTLIHDDILDGAKFRRHLETVNLRWNSQFAVLAGDILLTKAISLITECRDNETNRVISVACQKTCEGEFLQSSTRGGFEMTIDLYRRIIDGKTASLLEAACQLGAFYHPDSSENAPLFARFGNLLGMAFQIFDDILDLVGVQSEMGKTLGTDLLNQKPTLPLLYYLRDGEEREKEKILTILNHSPFTPEDEETVRSLLREKGSIDAARQKASDLIDEGIEIIRDLPPTSDPDVIEARDALEKVARFVVARNL